MNVGGVHHQSLEAQDDGRVHVIDQTVLPNELRIISLRTSSDMAHAIATMQVRGAPLIGVSAAFGVALGMREDPSDEGLVRVCDLLRQTRPTAVNLMWALDKMKAALAPVGSSQRAEVSWTLAEQMAAQDVEICKSIGAHALKVLDAAWERKNRQGRLNVLTHCNAGWLATVDYGTALSGIFQAHDAGLPIHVFVDETRPRNQGLITAWELRAHGVPHTVIVDNAGGLLMQRGEVDLCIVGTDRTTANGDVCNKVGTYLKALAAHDNGVPFYVAAPLSSIDVKLPSGGLIEIEERNADEVRKIGDAVLPLADSPVRNPAFDVTPARLVTALITERGTVSANAQGIGKLFA